MNFPFNPSGGLIVVFAELTGPTRTTIARLALDTGATGTLINSGILAHIGHIPAPSDEHTEVTTGSGVEFVPRILLQRIHTLGQVREHFPVLCHTLASSSSR